MQYFDFVGLVAPFIYLFLISLFLIAGKYYLIRKTQCKLSLPFYIFVILVSTGLTFFAAEKNAASTTEEFKIRLMSYAPAYSFAMKQLGVDKIDKNTSPEDPRYLSIIDAQIQWQKENPYIADIYTFALDENNQPYLLVDSETDYNHDGEISGDTEQRTDIGELYEEDTESILTAFRGAPSFFDEPVADRWGVWISSYHPITSEDGKIRVITGVDFDAQSYIASLNASRITIWFISFLIVSFFYGLYMAVLILRFNDSLKHKMHLQILEKETLAIESAKLAAVGEMVAGIGHEISNPLTVVVGYHELITKELSQANPDLEKIRDRMNKIPPLTLRIRRILKGLKTFARNSEDDPFETVSVESLFLDTLSILEQKASKQCTEIKIEPYPQLTLKCRPTEISQVLFNLMNNGLDAVEPLANKWIQVSFALLENHHLKIQIIDSGNGITPEIADKIMRPFFTTKANGKGTGLGLSISKNLIERHGGSLTIDHSHQHTCFEIILPLNYEPSGSTQISR